MNNEVQSVAENRVSRKLPIRKVNIGAPVLGEEEWQAIREPLFSGWLTQGPKVKEFEILFSSMHKTRHALATTSCTTGLHLILAGMGIGPGDEVIVPSFTWVATANAVLYCGATPVLVDVDPSNFNIDPVSVKNAITNKTKAIIAVHLFGLCADMNALREVASGIPIIEDAACAAGSKYGDRFAGSLGLAAAFSFHPRKSVTTGEGGMVTTEDDRLADRMNMLRNHGASISEEQRHHGPQPYILADFNLLGFNYRMTDIQAAVGVVQLKKLDRFIEERSAWARYYEHELSEIKWLRTPKAPLGYRHGWQSYVCYVDEKKSPRSRNEIMKFLFEQGINTRPGTHSIHTLGFYRGKFGCKVDDLPGARDSQNYSMSIPLHNAMSKEDFEYVVHTLKRLS